MINRTFLGNELDDVALNYNKILVSPKEFAEEMKGALDGWVQNMESLDLLHSEYPEKKMECFLAWAEFNTK